MPHLRHLTLQNIRMTDADVSDLLAVNSLKSLEEINISANGPMSLTEDSVFKLIAQCPRLVEKFTHLWYRDICLCQANQDWRDLLLVGERFGHTP